jgi:hypothetical protein
MTEHLELVGCLLELDLELHHGGAPAGPDDGGERHDGGHRLRGVGLAAPQVELLNHTPAAGTGGRERVRRGGGAVGSTRGVREPVAGDDGVVVGARLVVGGDGRRRAWGRVRVLGGDGLHGRKMVERGVRRAISAVRCMAACSEFLQISPAFLIQQSSSGTTNLPPVCRNIVQIPRESCNVLACRYSILKV